MSPLRKVKNILVTGGAGFIGSAFIRYLLLKAPSFQGTCINLDALTYAGNLANLLPCADDPRYHFIQGSICDQKLVEKICQDHDIDTIVHFAAESHVDRSIEEPETFAKTNILGTLHLLEVVRKLPQIHFHHVSTDEVYGQLGQTGYFTEETAYSPNSPYSASKAASDHLVRAYAHTYGLSTCLSNCSNNYGPYQYPEKLIPLMILNAKEQKPLPVYGAGNNVRDWLFVEDHAEALYLLLFFGRKGETYNIGGDCEKKNIEVVESIVLLVAKESHQEVKELKKLITFVKDRPGHDLRYAIDCSKIKKEIGWSAKHSFASGLEETVKWYFHQLDWLKSLQKKQKEEKALKQ